MPSSPSLQRLLSPLRELNPLWLLAIGILALLAVALSALRHQVDKSERLQQRLTGTALVDALKDYADATPPGAAIHPSTIQDLIDDNRSGTHRNWLDAASAEALADRTQWKLVRDAEGRVIGAQLNTPSDSGRIGLPAWLAGASSSRDEPPTVYAVEAAPPPAEAAPTKVTPLALPQPVLPDTPLAPLEQQAAAERSQPAAKVLAAAPGEPRAQAGAVLDPAAKPSQPGDAAPKPGQPSRILAGLEARQVLRLSGGEGGDAPVLTPRRAAVPTAPLPPGGRTAAVGAVAAAGTTPAVPPASSPAAPASTASAVAPPSTTAGAPTGATVSAAASAAGAPAPGVPNAPHAAPSAPKPASPVTGSATAGAGKQVASTRPTAAPSKPAAQGVLKRKRPPSPPPSPTPSADTAAAERPEVLPPGRPLVTSAPAPLRATLAPATPVSPAPASTAASTPSAAPGAAPGPAVGVTSAAPPSTLSNGPAGVRMDTVIYEDSAGTGAAPGADAPKVDCRALAGDSAECDTFEDNDPGLYQRCYQSLSERINACIAGEPIPSLVIR